MHPIREELIALLRLSRYGVVASTTKEGAASAALVGVATSDDLEIVFDTLASTRKAQNLRADPRVAIVIGWGEDERNVQLEGVADEPRGAELARLKTVYFAAFPDGPSRASWPGMTYFRVRPTWIRFSDYGRGAPRIVELGGAELDRVRAQR